MMVLNMTYSIRMDEKFPPLLFQYSIFSLIEVRRNEKKYFGSHLILDLYNWYPCQFRQR